MNRYKSILSTFALIFATNLLFSNTVYAYGSGAAPSCRKPVIKIISPTGGSGAIPVAAGSEFSFQVSNDAKQKAITASAKDIDIPVQISTLSNGKLEVKGNLPSSLTDGYASVILTAPAQRGQCSGQGKVLVQIN